MRPAGNEATIRECDVIVIGAGPAGMTAAIVAQAEGLDTLLLEKTDQVGGTAAWSAGMMWFVDTPAMRQAGFDDSVDAAQRYFAATVGETVSLDLQQAYIRHGRDALDYLLAHSDLRVVAVDYPDYYPELDGGMFGRAHAPLAFDGRTLGRSFHRLRGPIAAFAPLGGMMLDFVDIDHFMKVTRSLRSLGHIVRLLGRHAVDRLRHRRGTRLVNGNALVGRLYNTILDRAIPVWLGATTERLVLEAGRVSGVVVRRGDEPVTVRARRGVVIATGGYPANAALRRIHSRQPTVERSISLPDNVGDGIALATAAGGRLDHNALDTGYYVPISELADGKGGTTLWGHFALDRAKPGFIAVGPDGRRFTNEAASYHEFTLGMFRAGAIPAFLIADAAAVKKYGIGAVLPGGVALGGFVRKGYLVAGQTIPDLAARLGVDADVLQETVAHNNAAAATGVDDQFAKGASGYDRHFADPAHSPNPCLGPIGAPPFYAVRLMPGDFGTSRGLVTGPSGEVLGHDDAPIAGLFACGNDMNSPTGGKYLGAGITLGPAITFGYLAARALAGNGPGA